MRWFTIHEGGRDVMQLIIRIILGFVVGAAAGGLITYLYVTTSAKSKIQEMLDNAEKEASSS